METTAGTLKPFSFCVFARTEELLRNPQQLHLLQSFFPGSTFARYHSPVDLLFCEVFPQWQGACRSFYSAQGGRIYSYAEASPKQLLAWDLFLSGCAMPRLKELYLKGRRRWSAVLPELRLPQPPPARAAQTEKLRALPTSLGIHQACSEALEIARLRGVLCRIVHELVEAARFHDEEWFARALRRARQFVESLAPDRFGAQVASKILIERIHYVEALPHYGEIRRKFLRLLKASAAPTFPLDLPYVSAPYAHETMTNFA